jgi:hypothetical protein
MPSLRDSAQAVVLWTFTTRTSTTAAEFARSSQLGSSRPGQAVRSVREGGKDRPSQHKSRSPPVSQEGLRVGSSLWLRPHWCLLAMSQSLQVFLTYMHSNSCTSSMYVLFSYRYSQNKYIKLKQTNNIFLQVLSTI